MFPSAIPLSLPAAPSFMSLLPHHPSASSLALLGFPPPPPGLMTSQAPAAFTASK